MTVAIWGEVGVGRSADQQLQLTSATLRIAVTKPRAFAAAGSEPLGKEGFLKRHTLAAFADDGGTASVGARAALLDPHRPLTAIACTVDDPAPRDVGKMPFRTPADEANGRNVRLLARIEPVLGSLRRLEVSKSHEAASTDFWRRPRLDLLAHKRGRKNRRFDAPGQAAEPIAFDRGLEQQERRVRREPPVFLQALLKSLGETALPDLLVRRA
jgi:hypothetical protein